MEDGGRMGDMSMVNLAEVREALKLWDSILTEHPGSDLAYYRVLDAARAWLDLFEECENCGGADSTDHQPDAADSDWQDCPVCNGLGVIPNRERMRAAVNALYRRPSFNSIVEEDAQAAIRVFLG